MKRQRIFITAFFILVSCSGFCQAIVAPKILSATDWKNYFVKHFKVTTTENINTQINKGDIPYPTSWKYLAEKDKDKKDKYRLYMLSPTADFMTMPTANNVGTYLFFFDHSNPANNLMEMNFFADSILCKKLSSTMYMFQFNDDGFKINGDSSGFKRYVFVSNTGKITSKSLVAHGCSITLNSVDTVHSLIYLNVIYTKHPSCMKCFRLDYKNQLLLTDLDDVEDLNGSIILDAVHYTYIKKVEGSAN